MSPSAISRPTSPLALGSVDESLTYDLAVTVVCDEQGAHTLAAAGTMVVMFAKLRPLSVGVKVRADCAGEVMSLAIECVAVTLIVTPLSK